MDNDRITWSDRVVGVALAVVLVVTVTLPLVQRALVA